jgi:hypothetical protein
MNPPAPLPRGPTGMRTPPPLLPLAATTGLPPPWKLPPLWTKTHEGGWASPPQRKTWVNVIAIRSPSEDFIATQDVLRWVELLNSLTVTNLYLGQ